MQFDEKILKAAQAIVIQSKKNIPSFIGGNYRSAFRGSGMQFKEFRDYAPGDDVRHISWPVTARTGRPTLKVYEEERELNVIIAVDVSGSSLFAISAKRRLDVMAELVALLGLAALESGDKLGLLLFDQKVKFFFPPNRSRNQLDLIVNEILHQAPQSQKSDLRPSLQFLGSQKKRALIIILSDFFLPWFEKELFAASQRHEVILLRVSNDAEKGLGLKGVYRSCDPETGAFHLIQGASKALQHMLARHQIEIAQGLQEVSRKTQSDFLDLSVQDDYTHRLVHFFKRRGPVRF